MLCFLLATAAVAASPPPLVESVEKHLGQIDVSIDGPVEATRGLTLDDFKLAIDGKRVVPVALDRLCGDDPATELATEAPTSYLFYFDQRMMTMAGRSASIEVAKDLIRRLVKNGDRASIVSSAQRVATIAAFTDSADVLVQSLDRLRDMRDQFDDYPSLEAKRQDEIGDRGRDSELRLNQLYTSNAAFHAGGCSLARVYEHEEAVRAAQSIQLFGTVIERFATMDPPKVAIYFGDHLRDFPGRHYLEFAGDECAGASRQQPISFHPVHDAAAAHGVRIYSIEAQGLTADSQLRNGATVAHRDARGGLKAIALETGGSAFLGGSGLDFMSKRIQADASCVYVLSFDPAPFPKDEQLPVSVKVDAPKVRAKTRSYTIIQSESARRVATLLAAFMAPEEVKSLRPLQAGLVPLAIVDGKLRVLLQAVLPATVLPQGETWDVGLSLLAGTGVVHESSGRMTVKEVGVPIVFESVAAVAPGPFDATMVGMEGVSGDIAAGRLQADWRESETSEVFSLALMQPRKAAFVRDGVTRDSGSVIVPEEQAARSAEPVAFVSLVCRPKKSKGLRVSTTLSGSELTFDPKDISPQDGACVQLRDVIPAGALAAGTYTYTVRIEGTDVSKSRAFVVRGE
jgi:VWFA-related protein